MLWGQTLLKDQSLINFHQKTKCGQRIQPLIGHNIPALLCRWRSLNREVAFSWLFLNKNVEGYSVTSQKINVKLINYKYPF